MTSAGLDVSSEHHSRFPSPDSWTLVEITGDTDARAGETVNQVLSTNVFCNQLGKLEAAKAA